MVHKTHISWCVVARSLFARPETGQHVMVIIFRCDNVMICPIHETFFIGSISVKTIIGRQGGNKDHQRRY